MKKIYSILLAFAAILVFSPVLHAQAWKYTDNGNGVAYKKTISEPDDNGIYTITLESFVLGQVTVEQKTMPADIVSSPTTHVRSQSRMISKVSRCVQMV